MLSHAGFLSSTATDRIMYGGQLQAAQSDLAQDAALVKQSMTDRVAVKELRSSYHVRGIW